jgi:hypothetical protein
LSYHSGGISTKKNAHNTGSEDMVFENALLFLRDALLTREFSDAINLKRRVREATPPKPY